MTMPRPVVLPFSCRLVLFPQGQPVLADRKALCSERVLWSGGDVNRVIDGPCESLESFANFASRIRGLRDGSEPCMVVLTRTNPLALTVVNFRRQLESRVSGLRQARWLIFLDAAEDPFFATEATRTGHLTGELHEAPVWIAPDRAPFLVLSTELRDRRLVHAGLDELDELSLAASGERRLPSIGPSRAG